MCIWAKRSGAVLAWFVVSVVLVGLVSTSLNLHDFDELEVEAMLLLSFCSFLLMPFYEAFVDICRSFLTTDVIELYLNVYSPNGEHCVIFVEDANRVADMRNGHLSFCVSVHDCAHYELSVHECAHHEHYGRFPVLVRLELLPCYAWVHHWQNTPLRAILGHLYHEDLHKTMVGSL